MTQFESYYEEHVINNSNIKDGDIVVLVIYNKTNNIVMGHGTDRFKILSELDRSNKNTLGFTWHVIKGDELNSGCYVNYTQ